MVPVFVIYAVEGKRINLGVTWVGKIWWSFGRGHPRHGKKYRVWSSTSILRRKTKWLSSESTFFIHAIKASWPILLQTRLYFGKAIIACLVFSQTWKCNIRYQGFFPFNVKSCLLTHETAAEVSFHDLDVVYEDRSFDKLCDDVFSDLKAFCSKRSLQLHMTGLTRALLGFGKSSDFPAGRLCEDSIYFLFTRPKVELVFGDVVLLYIFNFLDWCL